GGRMISNLLLEAAFRSILLAIAVWIGLRVFSVKNVMAQKAAWGLVLASSLMMPLVLRGAAHVRGLVIPADAFRAIASLIPQTSSTSKVAVATPVTSLSAMQPAGAETRPGKPRITLRAKSYSK